MRIIPRVLNFEGSILGRSVYNKDTRLIPNAYKESSMRQRANLSDIFARENLIFPLNVLVLLKTAEKHSISATKSEFIWSFRRNYLVDVSREQFRLPNFDQLFLSFDPNHVDMTLILPRNKRIFINLAKRENVALSHDSVQNFESHSVDHVQNLLLRANKKKAASHN